jgi:membrane-associated phospholipid phosphatase
MRRSLIIIFLISFLAQGAEAQFMTSPWFLTSVKEYRMSAPSSYKTEIEQVLAAQNSLDEAGSIQIAYWNAGAPGYRWYEMMNRIWTVDTGYYGALANMLLSTAIYDATLSAWDTKNYVKRPRPYAVDKRIKAMAVKTESYSYPCEHAVAAGVAVTIISKFYPQLTDSVTRMANRAMNARIAAGMAFPSDTRDGFELGKRVALLAIDKTKDYVNTARWDGKTPEGADKWRGKFAMLPMAGTNKTMVLSSGSEFRPAPPSNFEKEMSEMKSYKQTFRSRANAFFWASQDFWSSCLTKKIFEHNYHLDARVAASITAITAVGTYDAFISCWDAKYAYWGIRPEQYDTTFKPLLGAPPFPGYPSGHAAISGMTSELLSYFFPEDSAYFRQKAREAAESRFQAGIHFRSDNEVALVMGRKVADAVIRKVQSEKRWRITKSKLQIQ